MGHVELILFGQDLKYMWQKLNFILKLVLVLSEVHMFEGQILEISNNLSVQQKKTWQNCIFLYFK